jgi:LPXTG-motif cell wall-anchored protein
MLKNFFTSKLRSRAGSFLVASSIAVATIAVAGLTESPVRAAPVSFGQITASRAIASNGTFNVYENEQISAYVFTQVDSNCLGETLQPGDVITLTVQDFAFSNLNFNSGAVSGLSSTLPDPLPANIQIYGDTTKVQNSTTGTKVFSPKLRVTRNGQLLVETLGTCYVERTGYARIDATTADAYDDLKDVSQYVAKVGDTRLSYNAKACVDMNSVAPGDVLTPSYNLTTGGQNVGSSGAAPNYNWSVNMAGDWPPSTIPDPEPTRLELRVFGAVGTEIVGGSTYSFSLDIKKGNDSVAISCPASTPDTSTPDTSTPDTSTPDTSTPDTSTPGCINNCGDLPPPMNMPRLYPTGQVSLAGQLTLGSTLTVSLPSWSLTDGGPALASTDISTQFVWLLCSVGPASQRTDITSPTPQCFMSNPQPLLADGTSFGTPSEGVQVYHESTITITQPLLNQLANKHLIVSVVVETAPEPGQMMGVFFGFNFKSCAPGENCADSFGPSSAPSTTAPSTTAAPTTATPTTAAPSSSTSTTVPPPALATVQALPVAPTPIVADATISTGEEITVSFGGFTPFEFVQLIVASTPQVIGSGYADAQGVVTLRGNLPSNLSSGNHTLAVFAPVSGIGFTQPITVSQPLLPATGSDGQNNLFVIAMLLFVLGLVVRRTSTVTTNK